MKRKSEEHAHQSALFQWSRMNEARVPALKLLFAVPNAARRSPRQGAWMKAEGMRAGVPDVWLPVAMRAYHGLVIEMKAGRNKPTDEQQSWLNALALGGWVTAVCYGWEEARNVICDYLLVRSA